MMYAKLICIVFLFILFSCGNRTVDALDEPYAYKVDTLMVDAKGNLLFLQYRLYVSDHLLKEGLLYNFNRFDHSIEKIDLNRLELADKVFLEKEGPNSVSPYELKMIDTVSVYLSDHRQSGIYGWDGQLVKKFDWAAGLSDNDFLRSQAYLPSLAHMVFAISMDQPANTVSLKKLDADKGQVTQFDIDPNGNYDRYTLEIKDPGSYSRLDPLVHLYVENDQVFVTHEFSNEIYFYNSETESVESKAYHSSITPSKVVTKEKDRHLSSFSELQNSYTAFLEQARFGVLVWDEVNRRYYRLSAFKKFSDIRKERELTPDILKNNIILSIFDEDLNLLKEMLIPELDSEREKYFVKDGSLWVFKNFDDEMGFVRLSFGGVK
jgi:hypothetical protein